MIKGLCGNSEFIFFRCVYWSLFSIYNLDFWRMRRLCFICFPDLFQLECSHVNIAGAGGQSTCLSWGKKDYGRRFLGSIEDGVREEKETQCVSCHRPGD